MRGDSAKNTGCRMYATKLAPTFAGGLPLFNRLPRRDLLGNSKGQGRKKKKAFGVTDSASLLSKVFVVG
jgi:hypothetical protein